jgi:hypothetical protein
VKRTSMLVRLAVATLLAVGCGSSGGGNGNGNDGGGIPSGSGTLTWKDNGAMHTALYPSGARAVSAMLDYVQVSGGENQTGISFGIATPPALVPGSYACSDSGVNGRVVSFAYGMNGANSIVPTCSIDLTVLGDVSGTRAKGTFSGMVTLDNGSARTITNGVFDVPLVVSSL